MLHRRLSLLTLVLVAVCMPALMASSEKAIVDQDIESFQCQNGGMSPQSDKYIACTCPSGFVGTRCQTSALEISQFDQQATITQDYTYFYFEPKQINYYQISLKICLPEGENNRLTSLVFLEVQRSSGKLKLEPSIYQTSPISFQGNNDRCQTFYTHFIPIRKKLNDEYQRVIFGIAIKNNSDSAANRWVSFLKKNMVNNHDSLKASDIFSDDQNTDSDATIQPQVESQKIFISCTYELYLVENYWGTFIIIMSAITLFVSTGVFLYTMRNKYSYTLSNEDILRLYASNPEDFVNNQKTKNDLTHFKLIMPIMSYELLVEKQKRAQQKYPKNTIKRRIQMHVIHNETQQSTVTVKQKLHTQHQQHDIFSQQGSIALSQQSTVSIENVCSICLLNFEKQEQIRQTPCRHIFHSDCIDNWCENTLNCPVCRQNLDMPRFMTRREFRSLIQS